MLAIEHARFSGKTQVDEEEETAGHGGVSSEIDEDPADGIVLPDSHGDEFEAVEAPVNVRPVDVWVHAAHNVHYHEVNACWERANDFGRGEGHKTEVAVDVEARVGGLEDIVELLPLLQEGPNGQACVDKRDRADEDGPEEQDANRDGRDVGGWVASYILDDIVAVTLHHDVKDHDDDRESNTKP